MKRRYLDLFLAMAYSMWIGVEIALWVTHRNVWFLVLGAFFVAYTAVYAWSFLTRRKTWLSW